MDKIILSSKLKTFASIEKTVKLSACLTLVNRAYAISHKSEP